MITKPTPSQIQAAGRRSAALVAIVAMATAAQAGMYVTGVPTPGANDYQINASAAASIYSGSPDATHANELTVNKNNGWKIESMLNFDVSSLAGKTVQGAALYLYLSRAEGADNVGVDLHSLNGTWDQATVTWNNYSQGNLVNTTMDSVTLQDGEGFSPGWVKLDVTPLLVQGWINENPRTTSYGLGLVPTAWGANSAYWAYAPNAANQPVLVVTAMPVPEPGALCLLGVGGVLALLRRRR